MQVAHVIQEEVQELLRAEEEARANIDCMGVIFHTIGAPLTYY